MIHTCAFAQLLPGRYTGEINVVPDDILTRTSDTRFMVPADFARVDSIICYKQPVITTPRVFSPSLETRKITKYVIPTYLFSGIRQSVVLDKKSVTLVPTEEVSVLATNTHDNQAMNILVALNLGTKEKVEAEDVLIVRAKGRGTFVPGSWVSVKVVPEIALEAGTYQLLGFLPFSDVCHLARVLIAGQVARPGWGCYNKAFLDDPELLDQFFGYEFTNCGTFPHTAFPEFQFLNAYNSSTPVEEEVSVIMFLKKV
jgi:hypothetical protein